ncbi:DUF6300 family protein [Streptomyces sp. H27-D2]|uniref:DUF6300 family protein n=1 Tax=Streptomyces sp. H27-D2 TaxID=3046304 RepID=UPI002DBEAF63|nr:DUF6300 family protein [Streptomyces sp. H27-D2]MEC4017928.1 DUF6300 family protein [Streptomyces sp. H27-D2]
MTEQTEEIRLRLDAPPACRDCDGATLLLARFPHAWKNARGEDVTGVREAALCPARQRGEPAADELLALFLVDGQLDQANVTVFTALAAAWVQNIPVADGGSRRARR